MTTPESQEPSSNPPPDHPLRPHSYDGIQEYDQRLPRWWLLTLYGAMVFAVLYWGYYQAYGWGMSPSEKLTAEMTANAERAERDSGVINDDVLWKMSHELPVLAAGKTTFETTCAACHKPDMTGLIGPNLLDDQWIHGGKPMDLVKTITEGVLAKGMPTWGPLLGKQKITEVVAYIMAHHHPGEEIVIVPGWTPPGAAVPAPAP
jgi:cytochrome c oxidase cbb3-type subunit 3